MGKMQSYDLILEPYCEFCPDFDADVEQTDITVLMDTSPKAVTTIRCSHRGRCKRIMARMKERAKNEKAENV